jgi:hypothetical protein
VVQPQAGSSRVAIRQHAREPCGAAAQLPAAHPVPQRLWRRRVVLLLLCLPLSCCLRPLFLTVAMFCRFQQAGGRKVYSHHAQRAAHYDGKDTSDLSAWKGRAGGQDRGKASVKVRPV